MVPALRYSHSVDGDGAICPGGGWGVGSLTSEPTLRSKRGPIGDISGIIKLPSKQSGRGHFVLRKPNKNVFK